MEDLIIIFRKENDVSIPILCSRNILIDDNILFENYLNDEILEGKVINIETENQIVTVSNKNEQYIVNYQSCFFPIIEVYMNRTELLHKQEIIRENITFSTICPKCEKHSRDLQNCSEHKSSCMKNKIKPYAFIKL